MLSLHGNSHFRQSGGLLTADHIYRLSTQHLHIRTHAHTYMRVDSSSPLISREETEDYIISAPVNIYVTKEDSEGRRGGGLERSSIEKIHMGNEHKYNSRKQENLIESISISCHFV